VRCIGGISVRGSVSTTELSVEAHPARDGGDPRLPEMSITSVRIGDLVFEDSPRLSGSSTAHIQTLAEVGAPLPPILVHRSTMRVIDGLHRVKAALCRGADTIEARFFDGDEGEAFVLAVASNIAHGLPLSLADRKAAAARIIVLYPEWSDRRVAATAGLSDKTVGTMRRRLGAEIPQSTVRVGRDNRARAVRPDAGRVIPERRTEHEVGRPSAVQLLRADPSLRYTEAGRMLLRWLDAHTTIETHWDDLVDRVPEHCVEALAGLAHSCAEDWRRFARRLKQRGNDSATGHSDRK
jgi:ParB-like nuclease domain